MLPRWLSKLEKVSIARTPPEREGIYRFRYRVYVEELKKNLPDADHDRKWLRGEEDEASYSTLLYTGTPDEVTGTVRIRAWGPGEIPPKLFEMLSLERFPGIEELRVAEIGRLMIRSTLRGKMLLPSLMRSGFEHMAKERRSDLAFVFCLPGLVRHYRALGARPYGGRLVRLPTGTMIPMVIVMSDHRHFRRCGSIITSLAKEHYRPGRNRVLDMAPYGQLLEGDRVPVEFDPTKVWTEVKSTLADEDETPTVFESLSPGSVKRLLNSGFVLDVQEGDPLTRVGVVEREIFIILEGAFEILVNDRPVNLLGKGEVIGEIAFFSSHGHRTAEVRALTDGKLLVLRRKFLRELTRKDPDAGFQLLTNLSRVLADRFARATFAEADE